MIAPGKRGRTLLALLALAVIGVLGAVSVELAGRYRWADDTLQGIEPRYARLEGLVGVGPQLLTSYARNQSSLSNAAYAADTDRARVGTDFQQRVRQIAQSSGLRVAGTQILPVRTQEGYSLVSVSATLNGDAGALSAFLVALETEQPSVVVERLIIQGPRAGRRGEIDGTLTVQMNMSVMHLAP